MTRGCHSSLAQSVLGAGVEPWVPKTQFQSRSVSSPNIRSFVGARFARRRWWLDGKGKNRKDAWFNREACLRPASSNLLVLALPYLQE